MNTEQAREKGRQDALHGRFMTNAVPTSEGMAIPDWLAVNKAYRDGYDQVTRASNNPKLNTAYSLRKAETSLAASR